MTTVDRKLLQQALKQGQQISQSATIAREGSFDPRGGVGVLAAQLATAGIGAFAQNRAKKQLAELEQQEQAAFGQQFPQFAGLAGQTTPETRQAAIQAQLAGQIKQQFKEPEKDKFSIQKTDSGIFKINERTGEAEQIKIGGKPIGAKTVSKGEALNLTKGEVAVDKEFAKEFVDFEARGGFSDVEKQLNQLKGVRNELADVVFTELSPKERKEFKRKNPRAKESKKDLTGPKFGLTPDTVMAFTNPEALSTKQKVEEVVQRNLRLILGAQFTEKEGERLISRAYDERLSEGQNLKRVDVLIKQIDQAAKSKRSAAGYFKKFGTLKGWKGKQPTFKGLPGDKEDEAATTEQTAAPKVRRFNPQTGRIE
jgi:hypothetical protein